MDLSYRGVDEACAPVQIIHRGKLESLGVQRRRWLKRRRAIEPAIGHAKSDHRMDRCWLLRAIAAKGLKALLLVLSQWALWQRWIASALHIAPAALVAPTRLIVSRTHHASASRRGAARRGA